MFRRGTVEKASSTLLRGLGEFFDGSGNGAKGAFRTGRPWSASELRLKSHDDLHKLWYVLLKEKNMLMTEKRIGKAMRTPMANPERIRKVKVSMARLKTVVNERSRVHKMGLHIEALRDQIRTEFEEKRKQQKLDDLIKKTREELNINELVAKYEEHLALEAKKDAKMAKKAAQALENQTSETSPESSGAEQSPKN